MATLITQGSSSGETRRCDATCHNAKHTACVCVCGGRYHGKGSGTEALRDAVDEFRDELTARGILPPSLGETVAITDAQARAVNNRMRSRLRRRQPGVAILKAVAVRLLDEWYALRTSSPDREDLSSALMTVKVCLSRCRANLEV